MTNLDAIIIRIDYLKEQVKNQRKFHTGDIERLTEHLYLLSNDLSRVMNDESIYEETKIMMGKKTRKQYLKLEKVINSLKYKAERAKEIEESEQGGIGIC